MKKKVMNTVIASGMSMILAVSPTVTPVNGMCKGRVTKNEVSYVKVQGESSEEKEDFIIEGGILTAYYGEETNVIIPSSVTAIGDFAFGCAEITSVTIPGSVSKIGTGAFQSCTNLSSVTISGSVSSIGDLAFNGCSSLSRISVPNSVTSMGEQVFAGCTSLSNANIPSGINSIPFGTFNGCTNLSSVSIPSSVTSIGDDAFNGCSSLSSASIPSGVTNIGSEAFKGCSSLGNVTLPNGLTVVESSAFEGCSGISSVSIPSKVTEIQGNAFKNCSSLTSATILKNVTYIGIDAFANCGNLTISGYADTEAERYAKENNIPFKYLDGGKTTAAPTVKPTNTVEPTATPKVEFSSFDFEAAPSITFGLNNAEVENIFPGSLELGFNLVPCQQAISVDEDGKTSIKVIFGCDISYDKDDKKYGTDLNKIKEFEEKFKEAQENVKKVGTLTKYQKRYNKKMASFIGDSSNITKKSSWIPEFGVEGYYEAVLDSQGNCLSQGGEISVDVKLSPASLTRQFMAGPIPLYLELGGEFEGEGKGNLNRESGTGLWDNSLEFSFTPSISLGGGVGISGVATVGAEGSLSLPINLSTKKNEQGKHYTIGGEADVALKAYLLFVVDYTYSFGPWVNQLLPDDGRGWHKKALANRIGSSNYSLIDRDYEKKTSNWNTRKGTIHKSSVAGTEDIETTLQEYIMPNTVPQIETIGDSKVMVFQSTDNERETANSVKLMYSVYKNGNWSEPKAVWDNGTADYFADIKTINDELYLVWQKSKSKVSSKDTETMLSEMMEKCEICYAKYNKETQTFEQPVYVTKNNTLDMIPKLADNNGNPTVVWVNNSENDYAGTSGTNEILAMTLENEQWSEADKIGETTQYISELMPYCENGTVYATFNATNTQSSDESQVKKNSVTAYATTQDVTTKTYTTQKDSAQPVAISDGSSVAVDVQYVNGNIYWVEDGMMKQYNTSSKETTDITAGEEGCISNSAKIYENGGKTAILWTEKTEDGYEICSSVKTDEGYSEPVVVQEGKGAVIQQYDAVLEEDGTWNIITNEKSTSDSEKSSFVYMEKTEKIDTELTYVDVDEEKVQENVNIYLKNNSEKPVSDLAFVLYDENNTYEKQKINGTLLPGETKNFAITADLSKITDEKSLHVLLSSKEETDLTNNVQSITIGKTELKLEVAKSETDDVVTLISTITNTSKTDTTAEVKLTTGIDNATQLISKKIEVPAGESKLCEFVLDKTKMEFENGSSQGYCVTVSADKEERNTADNSQVVIVYKSQNQEKPTEVPTSQVTVTPPAMEKPQVTAVPPATEKPQVTAKPTKVTVKQVTGVKVVKKTAKKAKVSWKKVSGVKGYQVIYAENKKFTKNCNKANVKGTSAIIGGLKKGKTYYIKIRAYKKSGTGKKYGKYSAVKKYKVR